MSQHLQRMKKSQDKHTDRFVTYVLFIKCVSTTKLQKFSLFRFSANSFRSDSTNIVINVS